MPSLFGNKPITPRRIILACHKGAIRRRSCAPADPILRLQSDSESEREAEADALVAARLRLTSNTSGQLSFAGSETGTEGGTNAGT